MQGDKEFKIMKQRIDYIDRMKGLAIFLVVMGHVYGMAFAQSDDVAYRVISSFNMPLFMFLSGLVACSGVVAPYWGVRKLGKKLKGLLLPLVVFGMCFTMTFSKDFLTGLIGFLESPNKNGYWYLMTLAVFYVSLSIYRLNLKQKWFIDVSLDIAIWGGMYLLWKYTSQTKDYFCLLNCGNFYLFFMLGVFHHKVPVVGKGEECQLAVLCLRRAVCSVVLHRDADTCFGQLEQAHLHAVQHGVCHCDFVYGTPRRDVVLRTYIRLCGQENA